MRSAARPPRSSKARSASRGDRPGQPQAKVSPPCEGERPMSTSTNAKKLEKKFGLRAVPWVGRVQGDNVFRCRVQTTKWTRLPGEDSDSLVACMYEAFVEIEPSGLREVVVKAAGNARGTSKIGPVKVTLTRIDDTEV